ncbi:MAG: hypothetical protein R3285_07750, partial [Kiloniellales bacterium]|nr:hypothetical protein [Kiloniellales bacterium]
MLGWRRNPEAIEMFTEQDHNLVVAIPTRDDGMCGVSKVASYATIALLMSGLVTPPIYADSDSFGSLGPDQVAALQGDSRALRVSNEFAVNLDNSYRLVIPDRC